MKTYLTILSGIAAIALSCSAQALAEPATDPTAARLDALTRQMDEQKQEIERLRAQVASNSAKSVSDADRELIGKMIKDELAKNDTLRNATPKWMEGLSFNGDLRLRYEYNGYDWGSTPDQDKKDRNRARFRARFGVVKKFPGDEFEIGFRLATGENNDSTSTNQTMTESWSKKPVWIDLAYAKYSPKAVKGLTVIGGKMQKPWIENEIFMDTDVNPEGFWAQYQPTTTGAIHPFAGAGYFIVNESAAGDDSTMYLAQLGTTVDLSKTVKYTLAGSYQEWTGYDALQKNLSGNKAWAPRGNDSPVSNIPGLRIVYLSNQLDFPLFGHNMNLFADVAHNCGGDDTTHPQYDDQNNAYATGVKYGQNKKKGDWSVKYRYAWIEANALPGNFIDSDFGFANRQGHVVGGEYNLLDNVTVGANVFLTQPIFSPTTTSGSSVYENLTVTVLFDVIWKF